MTGFQEQGNNPPLCNFSAALQLHSTMDKLHIETPLFESRPLSCNTGRTIWLKMESMQPPGSFKIRGVGRACQQYVQDGAKRLISSSGGNAGIAVAYSGRHLSVPVVVVVPETTTENAKTLIRQENAEVIVHGSSWQEANDLALSMVKNTDAFIHPFDSKLLWQGHSTLIDEIVASEVKPEAIILSVGGGGLFCGVIEGLRRHNWVDVPVIAVETNGADSFSQAISRNRLVELPTIKSIATSLGARQVCQQALHLARKHPVHTVVVSDREAVSACVSFFDDHRIVVEPACGASLSLAYSNNAKIKGFKSALVIVCGGATSTVDQIQEWSRLMAS